MTVSKVMRNAPDISDATKARVKQLASEMGYVPDIMAQSLRYKSARLFGLLISSTTDPVYARIVMAIEEKAKEMGYELLFGHTLNDKEREEHYIRRFLARRIDGLFVTPVQRMEPEARIYTELQRHKLPVVILGAKAAFCQQFHSVEVNEVTATYTATRHLIELGHKRIAFLTGASVSPTNKDKLEGYRRALQEAGIPYDDRLVYQGGSTIEEGKAAGLAMINESLKVTAVQACSDLVAIGAATALLDQGVKIPQEVSVMGFGNILTSEHFRVPLSTVRQPKFRLGVAAMEVMNRLMDGQVPEPRRLSAEVIVRQSTAKAGR